MDGQLIMEEKALELEYNNIKQEIFVLMQRCDNLIVSIYTVSITLMGLGYQLNNKYFFALIIIFIIPIHGLLNVRRYHMARCSAYISLCLESPHNNLRWEKMVGKIDAEFKDLYQKDNIFYKITSALVGGGMTIISFASILFYVQSSIKMKNGTLYCSLLDAIVIILLLVGFFVIVYLSKEYVGYEKTLKKYKNIIKMLCENNN